MARIMTPNETNVRFSVLDASVRAFPKVGQRLLAQLFLTPRRSRQPHEGSGTVIDRVTIAGQKVSVHATGSGPSIALVHGWGGHSGQFTTLADALKNAGFCVVTFDMPAHGESKGRTTSLADFVEAILAVERAVGPLHAVVGHSLGATACALALARGARVGAAVLVAPMISFDFALDAFQKLLRLSPQARELAAIGAERRTSLCRSEVDLLRTPAPSCPVLLVHDQGDRRTPIGYTHQLATCWPTAQLKLTSGLGHERVLVDPEVLTTVAEFVSAAPRPSGRPLDIALGAAPSLL